MILLEVHGQPYPQGSKSAFIRGGRAILTEGSTAKGRAGHAAWRQAVATAARDYIEAHPGMVTLDEPLRVEMHFCFTPVASDRYRTRHCTKPDSSKITRATEDALVDGGLIRDDALIWHETVSKVYSATTPGCIISIEPEGYLEAQDREKLKAAAKVARKSQKEATLWPQ